MDNGFEIVGHNTSPHKAVEEIEIVFLVAGNEIAHRTPFTAVRGAGETLPQKCEGVNIDLCEGKIY